METYTTLCKRLHLPHLREVDLRGANLTGANLTGANLREADLQAANLREANLREADLQAANLRGADLRGADLRMADLHGADLSAALGYVDLGVDRRGYHFRAVAFPAGWRITAGGRNFTVEQAVQHWKEAKNRDALARVAILKAHPLPSFT